MIGLSIKEFIDTLKNIIVSSPSSTLYVIAGIIFFISMIINIKRKKSIGKTLYLISWIFIVTFLITKYNGYLTTLLDNLINNVFMQIFFPNLATYVIIIILSNIIYIKSALKKDKKNYEKIINTLFFIIIMFGMNYTIEEIISDKVNIYDIDIYSNQKILVLVQSTTIVFILWQILLISKNIIKKLISISNNKIEKENNSKNEDKKQKAKTINNNTNIHVDTNKNVNEMTNNNDELNIKNIPLHNKPISSVSQTSNIDDINNQHIIPTSNNKVTLNNQNINIIPTPNTNQNIPRQDVIPTLNNNQNSLNQNIPLNNQNIIPTTNNSANQNIPHQDVIPSINKNIPLNNQNIIQTTNNSANQNIPRQDVIPSINKNIPLNNQNPTVKNIPLQNNISNKSVNQNSMSQNIPNQNNNQQTNKIQSPNIFNQIPK